MPKIKSKRAAAKRFRVRGNGTVKHRAAFRNHILTKKSKKMKRQARSTMNLHPSHVRAVSRMLVKKLISGE